MTNTRGRWLDLLLPCVAALYLAAVFHTGWTGDDAFITLRAVDNFVHGYGLVSNPPERVLGFTNPLWALLLALPMALGVGGYASALGCGLIVSAVAAAVVLLRVTEDRAAALVAGVWLTASSSYVDYSTSGLENPLAHLLLVVFFAAYFAGQLSPQRAWTFLLAALIVTNRQDHALLIAPALLSLLSRPVWPSVRAALIGGAPLWLSPPRDRLDGAHRSAARAHPVSRQGLSHRSLSAPHAARLPGHRRQRAEPDREPLHPRVLRPIAARDPRAAVHARAGARGARAQPRALRPARSGALPERATAATISLR